jgi:hypothetical protein
MNEQPPPPSQPLAKPGTLAAALTAIDEAFHRQHGRRMQGREAAFALASLLDERKANHG